jgi:hypothetical protein
MPIEPSNAGAGIQLARDEFIFAGDAVDKWRRRRQETLPRAFVQKFTPDWDWLVH